MSESKLNEIDKGEVIIYAETAKAIFAKCIAVAGLNEGRNMPMTLAYSILSYNDKSPIDATFIRNKMREIKLKLESKEPFITIAFKAQYLSVLANYANISNYVHFNRKFGPFTAQVMYARKPFLYIDFIRVPSYGVLFPQKGAWLLIDEYQSELTGSVNAISLYKMPGDKKNHWIKVDYIDENGNAVHIWFGHIPVPGTIEITVEDPLFVFFKNML